MPEATSKSDHQRRALVIKVVLGVVGAFTAIVTAVSIRQVLDGAGIAFLVLALGGSLVWGVALLLHHQRKNRSFYIALFASGLATIGAIGAGLAQGVDDSDSADDGPVAAGVVPAVGEPRAIAVGGRYAWVVGSDGDGSGTLSRVDTQHLEALAKAIDSFTAVEPFDIAIGEGAIWVTDGGDLIKLDLQGRQLFRRTIGSNGDNEVDVGFGRVWFKQTSPGRLFAVDPGSGRVVGETSIGPEATALAVGHGAIWVSSRFESPPAVVRVSPAGEVLKRIRVQADPEDLAVGQSFVSIAHANGHFVTRVDPSIDGGEELAGDTVLAGGELPSGVAVAAQTVWVAMANSGNVFALDECDARVLGSRHSGDSPYDVAAVGGLALVPNRGSANIGAFRLGKSVAPCS